MKKMLSLVLAIVLCLSLAVPACAADSFHKVTVYVPDYYGGLYTVVFSRAKVETKSIELYAWSYENFDADGNPMLDRYTAKNVPVITLANDTTVSCLQDGTPVSGDGDCPIFWGFKAEDGRYVSTDPLGAEIYDGISLEWLFANDGMDMACASYRISDQEKELCYFIREGSSVPSGAFSAASAEAPGVSADKTVVGVVEAKIEYTGPRPNVWYAAGFDSGHGVGGGIVNSSENFSSGRWGVLLCGKGEDGRYHLSDAYVVRYELEPWRSGSFCLYTQARTFDYGDRMFGNYFEVNPDLKLVYANLNSDKAYEVFTRFTGSRCELYRDYTPMQYDDNCVVENYGSPVDSAEATEWLYHYFGNELK